MFVHISHLPPEEPVRKCFICGQLRASLVVERHKVCEGCLVDLLFYLQDKALEVDNPPWGEGPSGRGET